MSLHVDEIRGLAALARLDLTAEEERLFAAQLGRLIDGFADLKKLAIPAAISPLTSLAPEDGEAADDPDEGLPRAAFIANAPSTVDGYLAVPRIHDRSKSEAE